MSKKTKDLAHRRLNALARERRRQADRLPAMADEMRRRLQHEVAQVWQGGALAEAEEAAEESTGSTPVARWVHRWRVALAWGAVAAACVTLVFVVRFPGPARLDRGGLPGDLAMATSTTSPESAGESDEGVGGAALGRTSGGEDQASESVGIAGAAPDAASRVAPAPDRAVRFAVRGLGPAGVEVAPASGSPMAPPPSAMPVPAAESVRSGGEAATSARPTTASRPFDLGAARRLRRHYQVVLGQGTLPPALQAFEVVRSGNRVQFLDADGSLYAGRVTPLGGGLGEAPRWSCEARGRSRSLNQTVWITGNFGGGDLSADGDAEGSRAATSGAEDGFLDLPFSATVLAGGTNTFEVHAMPVSP